jgi:hypothetical protein
MNSNATLLKHCAGELEINAEATQTMAVPLPSATGRLRCSQREERVFNLDSSFSSPLVSRSPNRASEALKFG